MNEPTLDHLTVSHYNVTWGEWEDTRKLTPAEFDRIAREWLREKVGDELSHIRSTLDIQSRSVAGEVVIGRDVLEAVLAALDGGQE